MYLVELVLNLGEGEDLFALLDVLGSVHVGVPIQVQGSLARLVFQNLDRRGCRYFCWESAGRFGF